MSRELFAIPAINTEDYLLALQAKIGAGTRAFYSLGAFQEIGKVEQDASDAGALTLKATYVPPTAKTAGNDLQCVLTAPLKSPGGACVLTFNATFAGGAITTATLASPSVITSANHGLSNGDIIDISGVTGSGATVLNANTLTVTKIDANTFSVGVAATGAGTGGYFVKHATATATFTPPAQTTDASFDLPQGLAVDIVGATGATTLPIRSIDSLVSIVNGGAGGRFDLVSFPSRLTAIEIPGVEDKKPGIPSPTHVAIADTYDATAWLVRGRDTVDEMNLTAVYIGFVEGLARLNGHRFTIFLEIRADGRLLTQRMVLGGCRGSLDISEGDGNTPTKITLKAQYEEFAVFV